MDFSYSAKTAALQQRVMDFVNEHVKPAEAEFKAEMDAFRAEGNPWRGTRAMEKLKDKARSAGLWNMFLPESEMGAGLTNLEYAPICEIMGRFPLTGEAMNCSAPDTGNMEILERFGTPEQKAALAEAAAGRQDPLGLRHDRARRGLVGRDQHRLPHRARRRRLRDQRPQVVDLGRARPALRDPDLDGQDRPRRLRPTASSR